MLPFQYKSFQATIIPLFVALFTRSVYDWKIVEELGSSTYATLYPIVRNTMEITREQHLEITEVIEDAIAHLCDELLLSGECVWIVNECLSQTKLAELQDDLTTGKLRGLQRQARNA